MLKKQKPIADPCLHAAEKYGQPFTIRNTMDQWRPWQAAETTAGLGKPRNGKKYQRHCGPVAITNLILTLNRRYHVLRNPALGQAAKCEENSGAWYPSAESVFETVSDVGMKSRIYWNTDILGHFGGTYDVLTGLYIRLCFRKFGIRGQIRERIFAGSRSYLASLKAGDILYLQLHLHPVYGSHHLICYGACEAVSRDRKIRKIYLICADGWSRSERYLDADDVRLCHGYAINCR